METTESRIPNSHWKILGHDWAVHMLQQHLVTDNARHAYLFSGPQGSGRRTLATRFIQAMNCPQQPSPGIPCLLDTCRHCRQIGNQQHPDVKIIQVPDGKSEIPIDLIHELQGFLMLAPYDAKYKVGLLLNFERANFHAQNALLKTLEEAPDRARILITADTPESLLPTIASRCELIRLRPLSTGMVAKGLVDNYQLTESQADFLDHLSVGRYGYAISLLNDQAFIEQRKELIGDLMAAMNSSLRGRFRLVEELLPVRLDTNAKRQNARTALQVWQSFFRDILMTSAGANANLVNIDFSEEVGNLASKMTPTNAEKWISACDVALRRIEAYNNPRMVLEVFLGEME